MSRANPQMRQFAERLIAYESLGGKSSERKNPASFHVAEKLRSHLSRLMGHGGFRGLQSRALALAKEEIPWLRVVHVKADGSLEGLEELRAQFDADKVFECRVVLLAQLLGLLAAFIGDHLMLTLVREVWPKVSANDLEFDTGGKNEKTK